MSDRPEIELLTIRPLETVTVARSEFMNREYGFASPVSGNQRLRHEYRQFARTARLMLSDGHRKQLAPVADYLAEVKKA